MFVSLILAAAAATTPPAPAAVPPTAPVAPAAPAAAIKTVQVVAEKDDPVICQSIAVTGSHFTEKQCLHRSQWEQQARDGQDEYESFGRGGAVVPGK